MACHELNIGEGNSFPYDVKLRDVNYRDLPVFFEQQLDPEANYMARCILRFELFREPTVTHWIGKEIWSNISKQ